MPPLKGAETSYYAHWNDSEVAGLMNRSAGGEFNVLQAQTVEEDGCYDLYYLFANPKDPLQFPYMSLMEEIGKRVVLEQYDPRRYVLDNRQKHQTLISDNRE